MPLRFADFSVRSSEVLRQWTGRTAAFVLLAAGSLVAQTAKPAVSCDSLAQVALPEAKITQAVIVAPRAFRMPEQHGPAGPPPQAGAPNAAQGAHSGPPRGMMGPFAPSDTTNHVSFCRVSATLQPSADSDIKIEVWLPLKAWNGKYLGVGDFGWAGHIQYDGMLLGLENGYAVAGTDTGHDSSLPDGKFALGHPDKMIDYGWRAIHLMTLNAKSIVQAFYKTAPHHAYFFGCSLGGQQALTETQRFPQDYDGVIVGAPAAPIARLNAMQIWPSLLVYQDSRRYIPREKLALIQQAVLDACDTLDGVKDGILENPAACHFDPAVLQCKGDDSASCLTAPQVEYLKLLYTGLVDPNTKEQLYAPLPYGTESNAVGVDGKRPMGVATSLYKYLVFQDENWDWRTLDPVRDIATAERVLRTVNPTWNTNLKPFFDRGGKLLIYHGWSDMSNPVESITYYKDVLKTVGPAAANSMRLFTVPGMGHCNGGAGCDQFDKLGPLDRWVTSGQAPERIVASKYTKGKLVRTHPVCAYPAVAKYKGSGSTDKAENFVCEK